MITLRQRLIALPLFKARPVKVAQSRPVLCTVAHGNPLCSLPVLAVALRNACRGTASEVNDEDEAMKLKIGGLAGHRSEQRGL